MILIIGEKPSVSRAISAVVGASSAHKGYTEGNGYVVSWCVGHLVGLKFPNEYGNGWDQRWSFSQLPMLPEKWQFRVTDSTKAQYNLLKSLMNKDDVTEIICATDADREGECIFRYVYNMANCKKPVKRLWVSSLEESAIRNALTTMKPMSAYDMMSACLAIILARKFKCKSIVEVRDLWPQTIVDYLGYSPKNPIIRILYQVEKWMYTNADELVFTMEGGKDYIIEHKLDKAHGGKVDLKKVHHINNGVDLEKFIEARENNHFYDEDLADPDKLCIVYTGSVRKANHLEYILQIAKHFVDTNVYFLVWGQGDEKEQLELKVKEEGLNNVKFKGYVEKNNIPSILTQADLLFLHLQYEPVIKYGYSSNKFFDYLAAEKPIIADLDGKYELVRSNNIGIVIPNDNSEMAAQMIMAMIEAGNGFRKFTRNISGVARQYDFANLTKKLEELL